jgi:hypothetical protein
MLAQKTFICDLIPYMPMDTTKEKNIRITNNIPTTSPAFSMMAFMTTSQINVLTKIREMPSIICN